MSGRILGEGDVTEGYVEMVEATYNYEITLTIIAAVIVEPLVPDLVRCSLLQHKE
jgi:hypothetical protein